MNKILFGLILLLISCNKENINLTDLLQSQQWDLTYCIIKKETHTYYAIEYQYRIQFRPNQQMVIFKQSGDAEYGNWEVINNKMLDFKINKEHIMDGKWDLVEYSVWGYDQDRIILQKENIEIGLN